MNKLKLIAEPGKQEFVMTRTFNAPHELVFKAFTDPELVPQWWGPSIYSTIVDKMDVQFGGMWRYINKGEDGNEFAFKGVYHEVAAPERLVYTIEFEGMPGHIGLETITFEEQDGKAIMTDQGVFQTLEDRDGMIQSGMEAGASETMDRLAALVEKV